MKIDTHLNIIFNQIKINSNLKLIDMWNDINLETKSGYDLNSSIAFKRLLKSFFLFTYFQYIGNLSGNILEVGVFRGFSGILLKKLDNEFNYKSKKDRLFLIDSFEGLSDIHDNDKVIDQEIYQHKKGHFKVDFEDIKKLFSNYKNVSLIKGWIPEVFERLNENNLYKFVHIDVDLYEPTLSTLNYIFDKVVSGGVIITDDYGSTIFPGNRKAWHEFFSKKNIQGSIFLPSGQAVYIKD